MKRIYFIFILCFSLMITGCTLNTISKATSFEERICEEISKQSRECHEIIHIDVHSNLVFYKSGSAISSVLTNDEFTKVIVNISSYDFHSINDPLFWQAHSNPEKKFSMIGGLANNEVKTVLIKSENNIQPNRIRISDNLWLWYSAFNIEEINMPILITAYDEKGNILYGKEQ